MAEVTEAALANRKKQVIFWGCCCDSVVLASDYVQAATVKPVHTAHSKLVRPQLQRARQPVVDDDDDDDGKYDMCGKGLHVAFWKEF